MSLLCVYSRFDVCTVHVEHVAQGLKLLCVVLTLHDAWKPYAILGESSPSPGKQSVFTASGVLQTCACAPL